MTMAACNYSIATNVPMTLDKLREMINIVEQASKNAVPGQSLMISINHNTNFLFQEVGKYPTTKGITRETPTAAN